MLFNTFQFLVFFVVVWVLFLVLRGTPRKLLLLAASYYFYMCWSTKYIVVIWAITLIDYVAGIQIEKAETQAIRKLYLGISLAANLGLLVSFKYLNPVANAINQFLHNAGIQHDIPLLNVVLPLGLSFHTFQAMSYTIDLYRRKVPAEHNLLDYALYVAFFPQMVAGPIERPNQLLPQFHHDPHLHMERIRSGIKLALWGLFKKMVIADAVAPFVSAIYKRPTAFQGSILLLATLLFSIQIYCDFSGYTDMAIGLARILGYELRINFRQPYFSRSIGEFWHRWHISLSTWFRDYVYIPLGGSRASMPRYYTNLLITFLVSGVWHGAALTFVIWGGLHGIYLIAGQVTKDWRDRLYVISGLNKLPHLTAAWQTLVTFALVTVGWVFFRAGSVHDAFYILTHLFPLGHPDSAILAVSGIPRANAPFLFLFTVGMFVVEWWIAHPSHAPQAWSSAVFRKVCYCTCAYTIVFFGIFGHIDFIYFQF